MGTACELYIDMARVSPSELRIHSTPPPSLSLSSHVISRVSSARSGVVCESVLRALGPGVSVRGPVVARLKTSSFLPGLLDLG